MLQLKRNLLTVAVSATLALAFGARAETAAGTEAETENAADAQTPSADADKKKDDDKTQLAGVTVVGIRAGIESAISAKQDETSIVEVISAEDIGKLPDISIADSISRLPGLAAQRVAGRSSTISIRGLSGDYGTTLMNGREQVSVGDNRTVEFDQFPSELINQVVVYKTPDAKLVGQGLSGTIDLRTVRPLMFPERVVSLNARLEKNSLGQLNSDSDDYGSRVSAFFLDQFLDRKLGIALGYARLDSPGQAQKWEAWGYPTDIGGAPNGTFTIGGGKVQASSTDNVRQGLMGVVEYEANEHYSTTVDVYYSKFDKTETTRFLETGLGWSGAHLVNPTIVDGVVRSGTFTGVRPVLRNDLNEGDDKLFAIGWNNQFKFNEDWRGTVDLSHSKADRHESFLETYSGNRAGITGNVDFSIGDGFPDFNFSRDYTDPTQIVLTDPGGWGQDGYIKKPAIKDELNSFRADAERSFASGPFKSVQFGINYGDREKQRSSAESFLDLINDETVVPSNLIIDPVDLGHAGVPGTLSYRINPIFDTYYTLRAQVHPDVTNKQWSVEEKITTAYAQLNVHTDLGGVPVRGNLGVQAQHADQSSDGFLVLQGDAAHAQPYSGGDKYTDFLPSLNLSFEFPYQIVGRVGLGRQLARPRIDQMRANNNTSFNVSGTNQGIWTRSGGNPDLKPWIANAFDVSVEKYWDNHGYVSLAYFYKDLKTYVYDQLGTFDASGFPIPAGYTGPTPDPIGGYTRPANGTGGNIHGIEAAVSVPFEQFADFLTGFGAQANFSDTKSSIKRLGPDGPNEPIAGLSRQVRNITLYYENYGFSARVSRRSRSSFLGEIQGFGADRAPVFIDGDAVVDAQLGYTFQEGDTLEGFSLLFQVNNATDEPYRQFFSPNGLTQKFEKYGRQYLFGITYKF